jgi:tetratricopeptide (TPR) repeat protein
LPEGRHYGAPPPLACSRAIGRLTLQDGLERQRAGDLAGAEAIYDTILGASPNDGIARTLRGLIWCETDRFDAGIEMIRSSIQIADHAFSHFSLGQALSGRARMAEAVPAFRRSIELQPDILAAHIGLGRALAALGNHKDAAAAFRAALLLDPNDPEPYLCTGALLHQLRRPQDALAQLHEATKLGPERSDTWAALGCALLALQRADKAAAAFAREVALVPASATAHIHLGDARQSQRDHVAACLCYRYAIVLAPALPDAHCRLSNALYNLGLFENAAEAAEAAIALQSDYAEAHSNRGNALLALQRNDEAEAAYREAIRLQPDAAMFHSNLGSALTVQRRVTEALAAQRRAIALDPGFVDAQYNHAISLLLDGQLELGWQFYETRWQLPSNPPRGFSQPQWTGEMLSGRTILLHAEQGLGDMLQMARYVPLVAARGGRVVLEVHAPLVRLLRHLPGVQQILPLGETLPPFDLHCPLFSLPLMFGTRLDSIPAEPYLTAGPALEPPGLFRTRTGLRVGLVWGGEDRIGPYVNRERSIALARLAPLAGVPGVDLYSLQKDPDPESARAAAALGITDLMAEVTDFADTAARVAQLDLVISVDTSTAHLAAAMGKPVWLLSRYSGCWRWLTESTDSPWYPSLRVYRQTRPGNWTTVIDQVVRDLSRNSETCQQFSFYHGDRLGWVLRPLNDDF